MKEFFKKGDLVKLRGELANEGRPSCGTVKVNTRAVALENHSSPLRNNGIMFWPFLTQRDGIKWLYFYECSEKTDPGSLRRFFENAIVKT